MFCHRPNELDCQVPRQSMPKAVIVTVNDGINKIMGGSLITDHHRIVVFIIRLMYASLMEDREVVHFNRL